MRGPEDALAQGERALEGLARLGVAAARVVVVAEVVERGGDLGVVGPEGRAAQGERGAEAAVGLLVLAARVGGVAERGEDRGARELTSGVVAGLVAEQIERAGRQGARVAVVALVAADPCERGEEAGLKDSIGAVPRERRLGAEAQPERALRLRLVDPDALDELDPRGRGGARVTARRGDPDRLDGRVSAARAVAVAPTSRVSGAVRSLPTCSAGIVSVPARRGRRVSENVVLALMRPFTIRTLRLSDWPSTSKSRISGVRSGVADTASVSTLSVTAWPSVTCGCSSHARVAASSDTGHSSSTANKMQMRCFIALPSAGVRVRAGTSP